MKAAYPLLALLAVAAVLVVALFIKDPRSVGGVVPTQEERPVPEHLPADTLEPVLPVAEPDVPASTKRTPVPVVAEPKLETKPLPKSSEDKGIYEIQVVVAETGEPYVGASLALSDDPSSYTLSQNGQLRSEGEVNEGLVTDDQGHARYRVPANEPFFLLVHGQGFGAPVIEEDLPSLLPGEVHVVLVAVPTQVDLPFHGIVLDVETEQPLGGATVKLLEPSGSSRRDESGLLSEVTTGVDGRFCLSLPSWDVGLILRATREGYAEAVAYPGPRHEDSDDPQPIRLGRTATVHAEVRWADGRKTLSLELVLSIDSFEFAQQPKGIMMISSFADPTFRAAVTPGGMADLGGLPPSVPLTVEVRHRRVRTIWQRGDPLVLRPGEEHLEVITMGIGARIAGHVQEPDGSPVDQVGLWLLPADSSWPQSRRSPGDTLLLETFMKEEVFARTRTDAAGAFSFEDLNDGLWIVGIAPKRDSWGTHPGSLSLASPIGKLVQVESGLSVTDVLLETQRGLYLRGIVVDPEGQPVEKVTVYAHPHGFRHQTDDAGLFSVGPLLLGEYTLTVHSWNHDELGDLTRTVQAGDHDLTITLPRGSVVEGILVDQGGASGRGTIMLVPLKTGPSAEYYSRAEHDGRFSCGGVSPGTYRLVGIGDAGGFSVGPVVTVASGERVEGLQVILGPSAELFVRVPQPDVYVRVSQDGLRVGCGVVKEGGASIVVPPGVLTVELLRWPGDVLEALQGRGAPALESREVRVEEGEVGEVDFSSGEGGTDR